MEYDLDQIYEQCRNNSSTTSSSSKDELKKNK